jgi:hypothetical protein
VGVAGEPASAVHVDPALEPQLEAALAVGDLDALTQRLVLEAARDVDDRLAARQPALQRPST